MIIDFHRHLYSVIERNPAVRESIERSGIVHVDPPSAVPPQDARAASIIREMDAADVDVSCLLMADYGLALGEGEVSIIEENARSLALSSTEPRLVTFFGIDPRRPDAAEAFEQALRRGARGLKLHPCTGFRPSDLECYPLYELAAQYNVPVATHTGPMAAPLYSAPADPIYVDQAATDFPGVNFVMLHAGQQAWFDVALDLARWNSNIHLEVSHWQHFALQDEERFTRWVASLLSAIGSERTIFGSDLPGLASVLSLSGWIECFRKLPEASRRFDTDPISADDVAAILGGNAARLLQIAE